MLIFDHTARLMFYVRFARSTNVQKRPLEAAVRSDPKPRTPRVGF